MVRSADVEVQAALPRQGGGGRARRRAKPETATAKAIQRPAGSGGPSTATTAFIAT